MNPFTRHLSRGADDEQLRGFIERWDRLEALVIAVFRTGTAGPAEEDEYAALRAALRSDLPHWAAQLRPHWQEATLGGRPVQADPFDALLATESVADFIGNWPAMQTLPPAREAINRLLLNER